MIYQTLFEGLPKAALQRSPQNKLAYKMHMNELEIVSGWNICLTAVFENTYTDLNKLQITVHNGHHCVFS